MRVTPGHQFGQIKMLFNFQAIIHLTIQIVATMYKVLTQWLILSEQSSRVLCIYIHYVILTLVFGNDWLINNHLFLQLGHVGNSHLLRQPTHNINCDIGFCDWNSDKSIYILMSGLGRFSGSFGFPGFPEHLKNQGKCVSHSPCSIFAGMIKIDRKCFCNWIGFL